MQTELEQVSTEDDIVQALDQNNRSYVRRKFKSLAPADIAECIKNLPIERAPSLFRLIVQSYKPEVLARLPLDYQNHLLDVLPEDTVVFLLNEMEPVDRTQLLESLPAETSSKFILKLEPDERKIARKLLSYPEDSVGRIMTPEFLAVLSGMTLSEAIDFVRWNAPRFSEEVVNQLFVVDEAGKYLGDFNLGALFTADDTSMAVEKLTANAVALSVFESESQAVDYFRKYDKPFMAVVDEDNRLQGVVMADDVFDVAEEEATEDIQQFGGTATLEDSYFHTSVLTLLRKRAGWLALLLLGETWAGTALKNYEEAIIAYTYLMMFLPLVTSSGGNSGSQAASLVIRGIAVREMRLRDWYRVFWRELVTGLGLGAILGVVGFCFAKIWGLENTVGYIVAISLVGVVTVGSVVGSMLPFILKSLKLDPAVSSSPLIASLVDLVAILIFFNVAIRMLA